MCNVSALMLAIGNGTRETVSCVYGVYRQYVCVCIRMYVHTTCNNSLIILLLLLLLLSLYIYLLKMVSTGL